MEERPFASMKVGDDWAVITVINRITPLFNDFFMKRNGRKASDQTSKELEEILKEVCTEYITKTYGPKLLGEIEVGERYDKELEAIVYDAYFIGSASASFK